MLLFVVQILVSHKIAILNPCYRYYFYAHVFDLSNLYIAVSFLCKFVLLHLSVLK